MSKWILEVLLPSAALSAFISVALNGIIFWLVFRSVRGKAWFSTLRHYSYTHTRADLAREIIACLLPEMIIALIVGLLLRSNEPTPIRHLLSIRWDFHFSEALRIPAEIFIVFWLYEVFYFFLHRAIHHPRLYRRFHSVHHRSIYPTPFTQTSVNILEAVSFYSFYVVLLFSPLHIVSIAVLAISIKVGSFTQHLGHECFPRWFRKCPALRWINATRYHQLHHSHSFRHNYGFQTNLLDRLFGTIDPNYEAYIRGDA